MVPWKSGEISMYDYGKGHMKCPKCGSEMQIPGYCPFCGYSPVSAAIYFADRLHLTFIFREGEEITLSFKRYDDSHEPELSGVSERNLFERVAEEIHFRRVSKVFVSAINEAERDHCVEMLRKFALSPIELILTDVFQNPNEFVNRVKSHVLAVDKLERVYTDPEDKIGGAHSTLIGGREGMKLLLSLASSPYVKKIVPGIIENTGISGGGVRLKLTRCDEKGNIRALLIDGASVQQIYVITTAADRNQGEEVLRELKSLTHLN
jgi:hypothetical protein